MAIGVAATLMAAGARADYVDSDGNLDNETFTEGGTASGNFDATLKNASFRWPTSFGAYSDCADRDQF
jgi:hypothetical protein